MVALLPMGFGFHVQQGGEVNAAVWASVEHLPQAWKDQHDWLDPVMERIKASHDGLARVLVAWGRRDVAEAVLSSPELTAHRDPVLHIQPALQEARGVGWLGSLCLRCTPDLLLD